MIINMSKLKRKRSELLVTINSQFVSKGVYLTNIMKSAFHKSKLSEIQFNDFEHKQKLYKIKPNLDDDNETNWYSLIVMKPWYNRMESK